MATDNPLLPEVSARGSGPLAPRLTAPPIDPFGGAEGKADVGRYVAAVLRYRWLVLILTILGAGGGIGLSRILHPKYQAQATIWIQESGRPDPGQANQGPIQPDQLLQSAGWMDLLRSYVVLDEVVRRMRLYVTPQRPADSTYVAGLTVGDRFLPGKFRLTVDDSGKRYALSESSGVLVEQGTLGDSIGRKIGLQWRPDPALFTPDQTVGFTLLSQRQAALDLTDRLQVQIAPNGNFMSIEVTGPDPAEAAAIANMLVAREVEVAADLKKAKLTELTKILEDQLARAQANLTNAENALESFRVRTVTLPSDQATPIAPGLAITASPVMNSFFQMKVDREQLRRDGAALEHALAVIPDSGLSVDALEVIPSVSTSTELKNALTELTTAQANLRGLRYRYTDAMPLVVQAANVVDSLERQTIPALARNLISQIRQREDALDARVSSAGTDLQQIPERTIEEGRLERAKVIAENLYTRLQGAYEEAHLSEASSIPDLRPLDTAMPPAIPISNSRPKVILMGFIIGLSLGLGGAVLLDRTDKRLRYPDQVTAELGLPILGTLPRISRTNGDGAEMAHVLESLRSIRLNVAHAYGSAGPLLFTISSPGAGDGKSFVSSNLAIAFADAGIQTLLIDGDLRRGGLHRVLNAQRKPGLTDYLTGTAPHEQIIQATPYPLLSFIGGGTRRQSAPELLGAAAMRDLVMGLRSKYQAILIDSPPLGAAVDPFLLATLTGNLLIVLRTGTTDRQLARAKLDMLDRLPVRILGAVLNDVRPEGVYRYYGYLAGYEAEEERERAPRQLGKTSPKKSVGAA